jgi:Holliday junction resolvase RusA-like endonuclease
MHAAPKSAEWRALAAAQMRREYTAEPIADTVRVSIVAMMPRPKSRPRNVSAWQWNGGGFVKRIQKPDVDNIAKAALDALVEGGVIVDDTQVVELYVSRMMCGTTGSPQGSLSIVVEVM